MKLIGVDIGGTGIKSALIYCKKPSDGSTFKIMHRSSVPTEARFGREHIVENICKAIDNYRLRTDCSVIGIGSAGDIDDETGVVTYATSALPGFTGLNLRGEIRFRRAKVSACRRNACTGCRPPRAAGPRTTCGTPLRTPTCTRIPTPW